MKGLLVVNRYLKIPAIESTANALLASARRCGLTLVKITNEELISALGGSVRSVKRYIKSAGVSFVLFWDKDVRLAGLLEKYGLRVFNSSRAIEKCDDKSQTCLELLNSGIKMPETVLLPKSYYGEAPSESFFDALGSALGYPIIIKECYGSLGQQVYLANDRGELVKTVKESLPSPMIFQRFIASSRGRDMRIYIVGGKVAGAIIRSSETDFRANASLGGRCEPAIPDKKQEALAKKACRTLGLDFAGVDLLFGEQGEPILCEVNSNAQFIAMDRACGVKIEDRITEYILGEMKKK